LAASFVGLFFRILGHRNNELKFLLAAEPLNDLAFIRCLRLEKTRQDEFSRLGRRAETISPFDL
jgi:hypothetical protein